MRPDAAQTRFRYQIFRSIEALSPIKSEWDALWAETGAEYYLSYSSTRHCWNEIHRKQGAVFCCAAVFDDGGLLGVLPMIWNRHTFATTATNCGPGSAEGSDMLIKKTIDSHAVARGLLQNFLKLARPDYLLLEFVRLGSHLDIALESLPRRRVTKTREVIVPYADLGQETSWTDYKRCLSKNYQINAGKASRRLNELGKITFEVVGDGSTDLIDWIFLHKQRWSERTSKRGAWVFSQCYREYLKALMSSEPNYIVFVLKLNEIPIAATMVAINAKSASGIITTYDDEFKRFSPGNVLMEKMLEYLFTSCRGIDGEPLDFIFGPGKENSKLQWSRARAYVARSFLVLTSSWGYARWRFKQGITSITSKWR